MPAEKDRSQRGRKIGDTLNLRLPPDLDEALRTRAAAEDRPLAGIIRQALRLHLGLEASGGEEVHTLQQSA